MIRMVEARLAAICWPLLLADAALFAGFVLASSWLAAR